MLIPCAITLSVTIKSIMLNAATVSVVMLNVIALKETYDLG